MIQLNLLPAVKLEYQKARRTQAKVVAGAILVCIVSVSALVLVVLWVYGVQSLQKAQLSKSIEQKSSELQAIKDIDKYVTVQNQLANISNLHTEKTVMSRVFEMMAKLNPKAPNNVRISALSVDTATATLTMDGETDTYTGLETFRDTLKNASLSYTAAEGAGGTTEKLFTTETISVSRQELTKTPEGKAVVSFKLSAEYNAKVFRRDSANVSIIVPNKETTQSKEDAPNVFSRAEGSTGGGQ